MGKKRATYIFGTIAGIALLFGMVYSLQTTTVSDMATSTPQMLGHATIQLVFDDGSVSYSQTDNQMLVACLGNLHNALFGTPTTAAAAGVYNTLRFYTTTAALDSSAVNPDGTLLKTELADSADITAIAATSGVGVAPTLTTFIDFDTVTFGPTADVGEFLHQIGLTDGTGGLEEQACSSFVLADCTGPPLSKCTIGSETTAKVTWTIATTT